MNEATYRNSPVWELTLLHAMIEIQPPFFITSHKNGQKAVWLFGLSAWDWLSTSVFYYEILNEPEQACALAKKVCVLRGRVCVRACDALRRTSAGI